MKTRTYEALLVLQLNATAIKYCEDYWKCMHYRLYTSLNKSECLFTKKFGSGELHSTNHSFVIKEIRRAYDTDGCAWWVFLDFLKVFYTVNLKISNKMKYRGIWGTTSDWFKSYVANRMLQTSIEGVTSTQLPITYGVPQWSFFCPFFFLIFNHNKAIKHSIIHDFTDDTLQTHFTVTSRLKNPPVLKFWP